ncbi:MAG TPA: hypothetical protein ENK82_06670 [Campylobacterales bacterium]|nr:hypothetical protein [Bacteroidota bacterium]HHS93013.1 hypothetical protein [Campylobacterales bacterium]
MLVQIVKIYKGSFKKYSPQESLLWDDVQFSEDKEKEADFVVVLNGVKKDITVKCNAKNVICVMQEPYYVGGTDWMDSQLENYHYVFTNHVPSQLSKNTNIVLSHGALNWHVDKSYDELKNMNEPNQKVKNISCIASSLTRWAGHKKRVEFINYLKENNGLGIDFFGKGTNFLEEKWDGIAPYKYSIAIENSSIDDYWTEKISDVYLSYSLPFYFGCTNIDKYFPKESYIWIDISDPKKALETMRLAIENNEYEKRLLYIEEARRRVLDEYNLFPFIVNFIKTLPVQNNKNKIRLKKYRYPLKERFKRYIERKRNRIIKIKKALGISSQSS